MTESDSRPAASAATLRELAAVFLKLGTIGFGGPAAHIALMEREIVRKRRWLTGPEFLDLVGAANLIPGPNSTEVAIHVGRVRAGLAGLLVAGASFILPAVVIVSGVAWLYQRWGRLPETAALLYGVKPVVLAIVLHALLGLGRTAIKNVPLAMAGLACFVAAMLLPGEEVLILFAAGTLAGAVAFARNAGSRTSARGLVLPLFAAASVPAAAAAPVTLWPMFLVFVKAGSLLFGSGYVLLAFLRTDLVERLGWLTNAQLLDAIAVGQITPGPVFTTATFIGFILAGVKGAMVATVGIFLPAFVFVALSGPFVAAMRRSRVTAAILDGVNVASLALMAAVTVTLAIDALTDVPSIAIALVSAVLLARGLAGPTLLMALGALLGLVTR